MYVPYSAKKFEETRYIHLCIWKNESLLSFCLYGMIALDPTFV